jgi:pimeloyl-ACP methyl ester carboxylesterase
VRVHAGFLDSWRELRGDTFAALADIANARFSRKGKNKDARLPVVVTGHSLGGALATLAAFELAASGYETSRTSGSTSVSPRNVDGVEKGETPPPPPPPPRERAFVAGVRTFGSPRVGDILFAAAYRAVLGDRTWRVTHAHDVVPSVPVRMMGFHHVPTEVFYPDGDPNARDGGNATGAPVVCDGGGEDVACSDGEWTHTSVMDHLYYLDTYICGCNS